jgi:pescadillo protein
MLSFLEFYEVLLSFTNFKLFHSLGLQYPPKLEPLSLCTPEDAINTTKPSKSEASEKTDEGESESGSESGSEDEASEKEAESDSEEDMNVFADDESIKLRQQQSIHKDLFKGCVFWLGREVPKYSLEFVIKSFGGKVLWDNLGSEDDKSITHQIVDRPKIQGEVVLSREYIQPQWVYDSVNNLTLLPAELYAVAAKLPPHLSPFVDTASGYVPDFQKKLNDLKGYNQSALLGLQEDKPDLDESDEEDYAQELASEQTGKYSETPKEKKGVKRSVSKALAAEEETAEQLKTAEALLPRKKRRLLQRINYSKNQKAGDIDKLEEKKNQLAQGAAFINKDGIIEYKQQ